jgi:hypothetical protein
MTIAFLNPSRSFDETRNAICFVGHDGMFQVRFFVEVEALRMSGTHTGGKEAAERAYLSAFDASRVSIQEAARKAYVPGRRNAYTLTVANFR